ncbi:unnamed protein product [Lampetra fluviatilis]
MADGHQPVAATSSTRADHYCLRSTAAASSKTADCGERQSTASASPAVRPPMASAIPSNTVQDGGNGGWRSSAAESTFQQRLPVLNEFVADDGDWGAFQRRSICLTWLTPPGDVTDILREITSLLEGGPVDKAFMSPLHFYPMLRARMRSLPASDADEKKGSTYNWNSFGLRFGKRELDLMNLSKLLIIFTKRQ